MLGLTLGLALAELLALADALPVLLADAEADLLPLALADALPVLLALADADLLADRLALADGDLDGLTLDDGTLSLCHLFFILKCAY